MKESIWTYVFISILLITLFSTFIISIRDMKNNTDIYEGYVTSIKHKDNIDRYITDDKYMVKIKKGNKQNIFYISPQEYRVVKVGMYLVWNEEDNKIEELRERK